MAKYSNRGKVLWARQTSGIYDESGRGLAVTDEGNVYVSGYFDSPTVRLGDVVLTNSGDSDYEDSFVAKYDSEGRLLWARQAGGSYNDTALGAAADSQGNCWVTGGFASPDLKFGHLLLETDQGKRVFVAKYNPAGEVQWAAKAGGNGFDTGLAIAADKEGNAYVSGYFTSGIAAFDALTLTNSSPGRRDLFVAKYDRSGRVLWVRSAGGALEEEAWDVVADGSGGVYATGCFNSPTADFGGTVLTNRNPAGDTALFVAKYDEAGRLVWAISPESRGATVGNALCADMSGRVYVAGCYSKAISFGDMSLTNSGWEDIFVAAVETDLPRIEVAREDNTFYLSWPANRAGVLLEEARNLRPESWSHPGQLPAIADGRWVFTGELLDNSRFFRLHKP